MRARAWKPAFLGGCSLWIALCSVLTAYYRSFTGFWSYDDEGTLLICIKRLLNGDILYDQIATSYGPFYYLYQWSFHTLAGAQVSHDSVRLIGLAFWVGTTALLFLLIWRATGTLLFALIGEFFVFHALRFFGDDVAHPSQACAFLLAGFALAGFTKNRMIRMLSLGVLTGAILVTKVNLGCLVIVALSAACAFALPPSSLRRIVVPFVSCATVLLPAVLMWRYREYGWAMRFCALVSLSTGAMIVTAARAERKKQVSVSELVAAILGCCGAVLAICWLPLSQGSSVAAMFHWMVIWPQTTFLENWYVPVQMSGAAVAWAFAGFACAWYLSGNRGPARVIALLKLALAGAVIVLSIAGAQGAVLKLAAPFLWLVAVPLVPTPARAQFNSEPRVLLALLGVIQTLYAFPVAGTQLMFTNILIIAIVIICLHDAVNWTFAEFSGALRVAFPRSIALAFGALVILLHTGYLLKTARDYYGSEPLRLPGANRLRMDASIAEPLREIVKRASAGCTMLVTEPGLFSLNFWSGRPGLAGLTIGAWMRLVADEEQDTLVHQLARDPHACVIYHEELVRFWTNGVGVSGKPLVRYIRDNFHTVFETGGYRLLVRQVPDTGAE